MGISDDTAMDVFARSTIQVPAGSLVERRIVEEIAALDAAIALANREHESRIANIHAQFANRIRHLPASLPVAVPEEFNTWTANGELPV